MEKYEKYNNDENSVNCGQVPDNTISDGGRWGEMINDNGMLSILSSSSQLNISSIKWNQMKDIFQLDIYTWWIKQKKLLKSKLWRPSCLMTEHN